MSILGKILICSLWLLPYYDSGIHHELESCRSRLILKKQSKISKLLILGQKRLNWDSIPTHDVLLAKSYKPMNNNTPFSSIVLYVVVCSGCWHGADYCARLAIGSPQRRSPVLLLLFCRAYRLVGPNARIPPKIRLKKFVKVWRI